MRQPLAIPAPTAEGLAALDRLSRTTRAGRRRTGAQIVLRAGEQRPPAPAIARVVREDGQTGRRWLKRYLAEGIAGLGDRPMPGAPSKVTPASAARLLAAGRRRRRRLGQPYSPWTLPRLADHTAEQTGLRVSSETVRRVLAAAGIVLSRPRHTISGPDPECAPKKRRSRPSATPCAPATPSLMPTSATWAGCPRRARRGARGGHQVMIPTPARPQRRHGIGAVTHHTGEPIVPSQRRQRRREVARLLEAPLGTHPTGTVDAAWENATPHEDDEGEDVVRAAAGRLGLLYLPADGPWPTPIERLRRHGRRGVTHRARFARVKARPAAAADFFARDNRDPRKTLSVIGSTAATVV